MGQAGCSWEAIASMIFFCRPRDQTQTGMSCLFRSLGTFVGKDADVVRCEICNFLEQNPHLMDDVDAKNVIEWEARAPLHDYIRSMRQRSTWGGAIEIAAFTHMTGCTIVVHDLRTRRDIVFQPGTRARNCTKVLRISYNGSHYEATT